MADPYITGDEKAYLDATDVDAKWVNEPRALLLLNRAFEVYYDAYQAIETSADPGAMRTSLRKIANCGNASIVTGWGRVDKLAEGFDHLQQNGGRWRDENTWNYYGGPGKIGCEYSLSTAPLCAANFLTACDEKVKELAELSTTSAAPPRISAKPRQTAGSRSGRRWARQSSPAELLVGAPLCGSRTRLWTARRADPHATAARKTPAVFRLWSRSAAR